MRGRRWPVITFALIGLNVLVFLFTHGPIEDQQPQRAEARLELLVLAARHPELHMSDNSAAFVESVKKKAGAQWDSLASKALSSRDPRIAQLKQSDDPTALQQQMDSLSEAFDDERKTDILDKYAFVPAHPTALSYLTANFLHGGWIHLIGNMWFLWLAGFILEDTWGRVLYSIFYLVAGAAALQFYAWCAPGSFMPLVGASGAVAALMGGFLVRYPKLKIHMLLFGFFIRARFNAPAYSLLPLWLLIEFVYGSVLGASSSVAYWAHVGGFLFGMAAAYGLKLSGLEQKANHAIESKIGWSADPDVVRASEAMEKSNLDEAVTILEDHLQRKPATLDALQILQQVQWRRSNMPAYLQVTAQICQQHLKAQDSENAWHAFEEYTSAGGDKLPAATWLEICRMLEAQQNLDRAASEYERLAEAHAAEKQSILALVAAGRLLLKKLNRADQALRCYEKANASKVPHLDWQPNIDAGLRDSRAALLQPVGRK